VWGLTGIYGFPEEQNKEEDMAIDTFTGSASCWKLVICGGLQLYLRSTRELRMEC
jgi:hypothetical protein